MSSKCDCLLDIIVLKHGPGCSVHAKQQSFPMLCFGCGVAYAQGNVREPCPAAHREHWGHEWVSPRVIELTQKCVDYQVELERCQAEIAGLKQDYFKATSADFVQSTAVYREIEKALERAVTALEASKKVLLMENALRGSEYGWQEFIQKTIDPAIQYSSAGGGRE